jgi:hypothetical protein
MPNYSTNNDMRKVNNILTTFIALLILLTIAFSSQGQTISYKDSVICGDTTYHKERTIIEKYDSLAQVCRTIQVPVITPSDERAMYVILADVISDTASFYKYLRTNTVNKVSFYARAYLQSASNSKIISVVFEKLHGYGIKSGVDVRGSDEIKYWETFFASYPKAINRPDFMTTEKEPYITGDYAGFYSLLRDASKFAKKFGIELVVYMGHPSTQGWDSIVFYADRIWLSNYITMTVYAKPTGLYDYVKGRWDYITAACKKQNKLDFPVTYIISLEMKKWGAGNDFMGDAYIGQQMFGLITSKAKTLYESQSSSDVKKYTNLTGTSIFYYKYSIKAIPKQ